VLLIAIEVQGCPWVILGVYGLGIGSIINARAEINVGVESIERNENRNFNAFRDNRRYSLHPFAERELIMFKKKKRSRAVIRTFPRANRAMRRVAKETAR